MKNRVQNGTSPLIELKDVSKTHQLGRERVTALGKTNLRIYSGELIAVLGPSGSGKTTLVHIVGGLTKPDHGEVLLEGKKLSLSEDKNISDYRNKFVGFVFQNFSLLPNYSVLENVTLPLVISKIGLRKRNERALQYLKAVGMDKYVKHRANQLSGGQRQRVAIARALANKPKLLIADEPTGNLDSAHGKEVMSILRTLCNRDIVTVLFVTHDQQLAKMADRVLYIKDGTLQEIAR